MRYGPGGYRLRAKKRKRAGTKVPARFKDGGGRRTRTFEAIRRLIYSQLPLPLGTLPRSPSSDTFAHPNGAAERPWMTVKSVPVNGRPVGAFMGEAAG